MTRTSELILGLLWTWITLVLLFAPVPMPSWTAGALAAVIAIGHFGESR